MTQAPAKYKGYGVIWDKDGNPRVDDPSKLHPIQIHMLSDQHKADLGLWNGAFARDAQGYKKLTRTSDNTFIAEEALVAVSEIFAAKDEFYTLAQRADVPKGETITLQHGG